MAIIFRNGVPGFTTRKRVVIQAPKLVLCSILLKTCVVVYVLGFQLLKDNKYLKLSPVSTIHRPKTMTPTLNGCDMKDAGCKTAYRPLTMLKYCPESHTSRAENETRRKCQYMDHLSAADNTGDDNVMISTQVNMIWEKHSEGCEPTAQNGYVCDKTFETVKESDFYVADIENFWIILNHAAAHDERDQVSVIEAQGTLQFKDGTEKLLSGLEEKCRSVWWTFRPIPCPSFELLDPNEAFTTSNGDHFKLKSFIAAAGFDLDDVSKRTNKKFRESGVALRVDVEYYNTRKFNIFQQDQRIAYRYKVAMDPMTSFEIDEIRPSTHLHGALSATRLQVRKHGVYLRFRVTGQFGYFNLQSLLLEAAGSFTLVVLCDAIVCWLATKSFLVGEKLAKENEDRIWDVQEKEFGDEDGVLLPKFCSVRQDPVA